LGSKQTNKGFLPDARMISATEENFLQTNKEICDHIFETKDHITIEDFRKFRRSLKLALRHYEFYQYDVIEGKEAISIAEFAKSLLVCLPLH